MTLVYTVQNHIHLGAVGASPLSINNEPPLTLYHVQKRSPHYSIVAALNRSRTANPAFHVNKDMSTEIPYLFVGMEYEVRVNDAELQVLLSLAGTIMNLVDNRHCPNDTDHSPYIRQMAMMAPVYSGNLDPMLSYNIVTLSFEDANTRSAI